jgi:hypothetical protein
VVTGIATDYGLDEWGSIPGRGKEIFHYSTAFMPAQWPNQHVTQWVSEALSTGVKQLGREAVHSSPSSAEVKNDGAISPLPHKVMWSGD